MIADTREIATRLSSWAIEATTISEAKRCSIQLRIAPDGLLIAAHSVIGRPHWSAVVPWREVFERGGTVTKVMRELSDVVGRA